MSWAPTKSFKKKPIFYPQYSALNQLQNHTRCLHEYNSCILIWYIWICGPGPHPLDPFRPTSDWRFLSCSNSYILFTPILYWLPPSNSSMSKKAMWGQSGTFSLLHESYHHISGGDCEKTSWKRCYSSHYSTDELTEGHIYRYSLLLSGRIFYMWLPAWAFSHI